MLKRLAELCRAYDAETDISKRHDLGVKIDDIAYNMSESQIIRFILKLTGGKI